MTAGSAYTPEKQIWLIDTHCHLEMDAFDQDREDVLRRARDTGIEAMITIGSDLQGNLGGLELSKKYDFIYCSVGYHPHDAKDVTEEILSNIKSWAKEYRTKVSNPPTPPFSKGGQGGIPNSELKPKVVAIGEIGLDYHYNHSPRDVQQKVFRQQLEDAVKLRLPVVIHSREAAEDTLNIVRDTGVSKGVFHCFSGGTDMAREVLSLGFSVSIAGPVTFRNAHRLREVVKMIPDKSLLIETDAPYLSPVPHRGRRNEPSYLVHTARAIADIRGISFEDLARITTLNAKRLFGIGSIPEHGEVAYKIRDSLYLNITNECTNVCTFCVRFHTDFVKGHNLRLSHEPTEQELKQAIGNPSDYHEVVFCGYGEPLMRLDLVKRIAPWIKQKGGRVRIDTNGHGNLINGRNILPELEGMIDRISVSLNAHDEETYNRVCSPIFPNAFSEVLSFIREARKYIPDVSITVVALDSIDLEECRRIAEGLGVGFRVRNLDVVG